MKSYVGMRRIGIRAHGPHAHRGNAEEMACAITLRVKEMLAAMHVGRACSTSAGWQ